MLIQPFCLYLSMGLRTNPEILGSQLATSPTVQKISWKTWSWVYMSMSRNCLGELGLKITGQGYPILTKNPFHSHLLASGNEKASNPKT